MSNKYIKLSDLKAGLKAGLKGERYTGKNFTGVDTIYKQQLKTVTLKIRDNGRPPVNDGPGLKFSTKVVYQVVNAIYADLDDDQQHLVMLVLNEGTHAKKGDANYITGFKVLSSGGKFSHIADPQLVFRNALLLGADAIILVQNHPTGIIEPSAIELGITMALYKVGKALKLRLIDHLIVTDQDYLAIIAQRLDLFPDEANLPRE